MKIFSALAKEDKTAANSYIKPDLDFKRSIESVSLLISEITMENVQRLQQVLASYGPIKSLDTRKVDKKVLMVNYFDLETARNAYNGIKEKWKEIKVDYNLNCKTQLTSISESSDSGGSEEGNDSERKAKESLERTKQKLKEEYENPDSDSSEGKSLPINTNKETISDCQYSSVDVHGGDASFDNDTPNEEIKVNFPIRLVPRLIPKIQSSPSAILQTESTNMDAEDSYKPSSSDSGVYDSPENFL